MREQSSNGVALNEPEAQARVFSGAGEPQPLRYILPTMALLAYFLTWSCYGTWLHGDERGSVDNAHNKRDTPRLVPDARREDRVAFAMTGETFTLSAECRAIVEDTIRKWYLHAVNPRSTHVHTVVACEDKVSPEAAMEQFKAWCTRRLREAGLAGSDQKIWTEHGSTRWIDSDDSLAKAIHYVLHRQ